eukprot:tig00021583_g22646.t1
MGAKAKGKQAASSQEEAASGAPPIDARPVRIARPKYISAWLDLDVRPRCSVCAAERLLPPAYVPACLARNIAELAGGGDLDRAIDLNDEPTGHLLQRHGLVCLACVPKVLAPTGAAGDEEGEIECPMLQSACSEPHPTLSALVPSSRVDGYLAYRAFVHEAERPESWTAAEGVSRAIQLAALTSCRRAPPTSGGAGPSSSRGPAAPAAESASQEPPAGGSPSAAQPAPARKGGADSNASTPRRSGRAGASQASTAAEGSSAAAAGGAPAPAPAPAARATRARRMAPAAAEDKDELEDEEPPLAIEAPKGPPAKRQRRPASSERRPPWESEKLQRILYDAYTCKREDFDEEDDEDGAGEGEGEGEETEAPGAGGGGGGSGGEPAGEDGPMNEWEEQKRAEFETQLEAADRDRDGEETSDSGSDADAEHEGAGSGSGGEGGEGEEAVSERSEGTLSLRELERGLRRGVDAALVGIQLDGDPAARRALLLRAQHAGRERIRCLLLASTGILGAYERYVEANGRNPRSWGYFRRDRVEPRYNHILEACGLRLEERSVCAKAYSDLAACARVLQRLPGLARVVGDGVSPADFVAFLPNLQRADEAALEEIEKRLDERVRKLVDSKGEPLVRMPKNVFRIKAAGASDADGSKSESDAP